MSHLENHPLAPPSHILTHRRTHALIITGVVLYHRRSYAAFRPLPDHHGAPPPSDRRRLPPILKHQRTLRRATTASAPTFEPTSMAPRSCSSPDPLTTFIHRPTPATASPPARHPSPAHQPSPPSTSAPPSTPVASSPVLSHGNRFLSLSPPFSFCYYQWLRVNIYSIWFKNRFLSNNFH
ncbi:hypothetical protein U1Q18_025488 [Sarracenia purpurea var. burkii]